MKWLWALKPFSGDGDITVAAEELAEFIEDKANSSSQQSLKTAERHNH